ncbi:LytR/AlgR family response regulator transcription factor [Vallitalea okinawensis]|uniref:LytR/AlgR family response regulator transcription factor n=1 Tax=Vallitalea okinawensis TaxID=2078660 RepID=UPI000CFB32AD|nr:LytTR family DNA-binding domain-containing protein [Vallitalea okinawensis]
MRVILVDDEKPALEELEYILKSFGDIHIAGKYTDPVKALEDIKDLKPEVVFLDISMPEMDGFLLADAIMKLDDSIQIVFATAYDEYAIQAFDINAVDYIMKPFYEDRINKTIQRIRKGMGNRSNENNDNIKNAIKGHSLKKCNKLAVWLNDRIILINQCNILYCTVKDGATYIITKDNEFYVPDTLSKLEEQLECQHFFRCHRSYIINIEQIEEIIPWFNNTYNVKMFGCDEKVPVSRRHIKDFKNIFNF